MVKRVLFFAGICLILISAKKKEEGEVILSGKIENPNSDSVQIRDAKGMPLHTIRLKPDHTFSDTIHVRAGYYTLRDGKERTQVYLKPGFELYLTLDARQFDETIAYKGKGEQENNYLAKKALVEEGFGIRNYYGYYGKLEERSFLALADSLHDEIAVVLDQYKSRLDKGFLLAEARGLDFERRYKWMNYQSMHRFLTGDKEFTVSQAFPDPYRGLDLSDGDLLDLPFYTSLVEGHINDLVNNDKSKDSGDYYLIYLAYVCTEIKSPAVREVLAFNVGNWRMGKVRDLDMVYEKLKTLISNEIYLKEIDANYRKLKKIQKGAPSPAFVLNDIDGREVSLASLKGKLVYIDIWATWCLPCLKEIPALKALEENYRGRDIYFVSICKKDEMERWKQMVREKALGGIQLFAPDPEMAFFEDYLIEGIPHFILLDREGRIIEANAMRPSNEKLKEQIDLLL